MKPLHNKFSVFLILSLFFFWTGCEYEYVKPVKVVTTTPISFSNEIVPIFTANCIGCHKTGGTPPDFSATNAYQSIQTKALTDTLNHESSLLYQRITKTGTIGSAKGIMPPSGKMPDSNISLILTWIKQGAKNN